MRVLFFLFIFSLLFVGCAPVFSELQSARTVGKNRVEVLPYYTNTSATSDGETDGIQSHIGLQAAYGITEKLDLRFRFEHVWLADTEGDDGTQVIAIGPKYNFIDEILSAYLPVGRALGDGTDESWQIQPTVLVTLPAVDNILDVNLSPKYILTLGEGQSDFFAANLGLAVSTNLNRWAVRPEYGMCFPLEEGSEGHYGQFSIGFSYTIGN